MRTGASKAVAGPGCLRYTLSGHYDRTKYHMLTSTDSMKTGGDSNGEPVDCHRYALDSLARIAGSLGLTTYLVGGPVRDCILGTPTTDWDVTVVGDAVAVAENLAAETNGRLTVHQRFGTATVKFGTLTIDLVTARHETYRAPGALPEVNPGEIADDLARRDFTINAMAMPLPISTGDLVDPHRGRADLEAGLIRVLHRGSFIDDPTRILRAVRYAARFGFTIEPETARLMSESLAARALSTLTPDRLRHEMERIFQEPNPAVALWLADDSGLLAAINPTLTARHLPQVATDSVAPLTWLAALAWPLSAHEGAALSAKLNAPSDWARVIADAGRIRELGPAVSNAEKPSEVCALLDGCAPDALRGAIMMAADLIGDRIRCYLSEWWSVAPRLRGTDLLNLGIPVGPEVGEALRELRRARLDGETQSLQDEQELARKWVKASDKIAC